MSSEERNYVGRGFLKYITGRSRPIPEEQIKDLHDSFSYERYYVNDTYRDVTVVMRNGLTVHLPRAVFHHSRENDRRFRVRTVFHFRNMRNVSPALKSIQTYARQHGVSTEDLELLEKEIRQAIGPNYDARFFTRELTLEHSVDEDDLDTSLGAFFPEEDVLVVDTRYSDRVFHPHSIRGRAQEKLDPLLDEIRGTGMLIEIVDNEKNISTRFIHVLGKTVEIRPRVDPTRASGVYVIRAEDTLGTDLRSKTEFMTIEEAYEKIGLYRTREEAITGGDVKLLASERVAEAEARLKSIEQEITQKKHSLEELRIEGQRQEHELRSKERQEQTQYTIKKLERDDHYDSRSASRRDTSETIKLSTVIVGAVITAASGLAGWYFSRKKSTASSAIQSVASKAIDTVKNVCSSIASTLSRGFGSALSWIF